MHPITSEEVRAALDRAVEQVRRNLPLYTDRCQNHSSVNGVYPPCENVQWTCGFWPGEIWLAYERTGEEVFRRSAMTLVESFARRIQDKVEVDRHDMGFLYTPSCVAACRLTGDREARKAALLAADQLKSRFQEKGGFLQAWGAMGAPENYRFIIDCLLNLPLLYWASEETGDGSYAGIARRHTAACLKYSFRPDGSTYHTFFMDPETGAPVRGETCQGYRSDSFWARGQAWAVYGSILSWRCTRDPAALSAFHRALDFYLTRLPEDLVPCWDMLFQPESGEPRDSSSAAIAACGLLEAARLLEGEERERCALLARQMVGSLAADYAAPLREGGGLLLHGTYSKKSPYNTCTPEGVDECTSWGDYFYMEALTRLAGDWKPYW